MKTRDIWLPWEPVSEAFSSLRRACDMSLFVLRAKRGNPNRLLRFARNDWKASMMSQNSSMEKV